MTGFFRTWRPHGNPNSCEHLCFSLLRFGGNSSLGTSIFSNLVGVFSSSTSNPLRWLTTYGELLGIFYLPRHRYSLCSSKGSFRSFCLVTWWINAIFLGFYIGFCCFLNNSSPCQNQTSSASLATASKAVSFRTIICSKTTTLVIIPQFL